MSYVFPAADGTLESGQGSSVFSEPHLSQLSMSYSSPATSQQQQVPGQGAYPPSSQAPQQHTAYPQQPMVSHRRWRAKSRTHHLTEITTGHIFASLICSYGAILWSCRLLMNSTLIMLQYSSSNFPTKTVISTPQNFSENSLMHKAVEVQKADGFYILSRCRESQRSIEIGPKLVVLNLFDSKATHCPAQYSKDFFFSYRKTFLLFLL